ncbi:MAG: response regulator, partial [Armatimonadetes bacterium]|nr:response regulator [Armatimonadota bacterium]
MVNVLLVDDRPENLPALEGVLTGMGLNLVRANSGKEALNCCLARDFAAILLDVMMPEMDGFETAALIRARGRCRNTPLIFITAEGMTATHESQGYALGAVDYIMKPFDPEALRAKVRMLAETYEKTRDLEEQLREATADEDKVNILLVDDNPANRLANAAALRELGERVMTAASGVEALRLLLAGDFAVALLDVHMPHMDGFELANRIREHDRLRDMPIVFLTATANASDDVPRGYGVGAVDFIFLPCSPEILRSKVKALVELRKRTFALERQLQEIQRLNGELARSEAELRELNEVLEQRVTERTDALLSSEERLRDLFDNAHDLIASVAPDGSFQFVNRAWLNSLDYSPEELPRLRFMDILHPDSREHCMETFQRLMSGETVA